MPLRQVQIMNKSRVVPEGTTKRYREGNFHSSYATLNELGRGRFAVVRKCKHKESNRHYAAKFVRKRKMGRDCREDILKEIRILENSFSNQRLIGLHEVYETSTEVILVLEYASGGELHQYCVADKEDAFCERDVVRLLRQIIEGVSYLHSQNIAHLDLKPQNILLTSKEPSKGDIKLIDFGIARYLNNGEEIRDIQGTPDYVAPEILNYEPITLATDMWSIGVLTYVMLTGISPFAGDTKQETFLNISQVNLDFAEEDFECHSPEAQDFIQSLCIMDSEKRLKAQECLEHPWLQKFCSEESTVQELDANENLRQQEKYSNNTEVSSLTINLVINKGDSKITSKPEKDDENDNYLDNRLTSTNEPKIIEEAVLESSQTADVRSGIVKAENISDMDVHMDCEIRDGHVESTIPDLIKGHDEVKRSPQYSVSVGVVESELERRASLTTQIRQTIAELQEESSSGSSSSLESSLLEQKKCRSCNRLHPEAPSTPDRSRSPSSSPMGTRRALCPNKENLPKDIREPKRFCLDVPAQQPGQVVC